MASIKRMSEFTYKITVSNGYDVNGKKIRETTTFKVDPKLSVKQQQKSLDKFVFEFEELVKNGKLLQGNKINLKNYAEKWLKEYALNNIELSSYNSYELNLRTKIIPALGHLKLSDIKPLHLQGFYNNLLEDGVRLDGKKGGYSPGTIKKCHVLLSSLFSTAVQWQLIERSPCDRIKPPKQEKTNEIKYFTLEQTDNFLRAIEMTYTTTYKAHLRVGVTGKSYQVPEYQEGRKISTQFKVFFQIAIFGGLRKGEILALTWKDIDFKENIININKETIYTNGKTITKDPKSKASIRTITMPLSVIELIRQYKKEQMEYRDSIGDQWQGENHLFIQWNGMQMHPSTPYHTFQDIIYKYNANAVENEKLPFIPLHGLRHTSATLLVAGNVDVRTVSARLGHAQTSTTLNIYAHALKEKDAKAADTLESIFKNKV